MDHHLPHIGGVHKTGAGSVPRGGFYIHDSTKGYTHGCIEVEPRFFEVLRHLIATMQSPHGRPKDRLNLLVKYLPGQTTNGGTYRFG